MGTTTIKDVARAAGVSHATVSRALNGHTNVSSRSRERVENAARRLGYRVNMLARGLACNRTSTLGLLLPSSINPFFAEMSQAIIREARLHRQAVIVDMFDIEAHDELERLQVLREHRVDGVLIGFDTFAPSGRKYIQELQRGGFPLVVLSVASATDLSFTRVAGDDEAGGYTITKHLVDLGHHRIAIILDRMDLEHLTAYRVRGYQQALSEARDRCSELIVTGADSPEAIRKLTIALMQEHNPTAIVGCNDYTAIIIQHTLIEAGFRIPQDVSVVGFDGIAVGAHIIPPLTTVVYPWAAIAQSAIALLLEQVEAKFNNHSEMKIIPNRQILFPHNLVIRKSSGPPPA